MPLICGSPTVARFRADGPCPADAADRLLKNKFISIDETTDESAFGWTNADEMLDCGWKQSPPEKGAFICFGLRQDKRKIPPALLKKEVDIAIAKELEKNKEQGKNFISRDRKREIKEQTVLRLRARTAPTPSMVDAVWDPASNIVMLGTGNQKTIDLFRDFFTLTFDVNLTSVNPGHMVLRETNESSTDIEGLVPTLFTKGA